MAISPYCTDEAVYTRAPGDYLALIPKNQIVAAIPDGSISSIDRWTITSPTVDFAARGVGVGMGVSLTSPPPWTLTTGDLLFVSAFTSTTLALKRNGQDSGGGEPPGPVGGLTGTVRGMVLTLRPQIIKASYELDRLYGVDDLVWGRRHVDQYDPQELEDLTVLTVLLRLYVGMARGSTNQDHWFAKAGEVKAEKDDLMRRVSILWKASPEGQDKSSPFTTRVQRG